MKKVNFNIRIEKELRDEFRKVAESNAQTPSALVRMWIEKYLKENKKTL